MTIQIKDKGTSAEVYLYGEVLTKAPRDWWTDEKLEGDFIDLETFKTELAKIEDKEKFDFHINSCGGDYYAGLAIYNQIKQLKGEVNIIVDGLAASAASIIAMAGKLTMSTGSVLMIHPPMCLLFGYYNAADLKEINKRFDTVVKSALSVYAEKNKKRSKEDIENDINSTTWLVDNEAVEYGYADELLGGDKPVEMKMSADLSSVIVNGVKFNSKNFSADFKSTLAIEERKKFNLDIKDFMEAVKNYTNKTHKNIEQEEQGKEKEIMCKTVEELKEKFPELTDELVESVRAEENSKIQEQIQNAIKAERERISQIEEIENSIADKELVAKAKFSENSMTAQELAFESMKNAKADGEEFLKKLDQDNQDSGANKILNSEPPMQSDVLDAEKKRAEAVEGMKNAFKNLKK